MSKNTLFFFATLFFVQICKAQTSPCGTVSTHSIDYNTLLLNKQSRENQGAICVNIQFHILRDTNGNNAISSLAISSLFSKMDNVFNSYNIFFNRLPINYIANSDHFNISANTFSELIQIDHNSKAINIYIVNYIASAYGIAEDTPSTSLAIRVQNNNLNSTLIHEIGHCFGLHHTHETDFGTENIERTGPHANCSDAGDQLCSTPADPQLNIITSSGDEEYKVNQNCIYIGNETRNELPFTPDTHNFMSYSRPHCLTSFTQEQGDVIYTMLQNNPILQPVVSDLCIIMGSSRICTSETYTVGNSNNLPVTWTVSPNLRILSPTSTSVTVEQKNPYQDGEGYIEAQVSSGTLRKDVWVGGPKLFTFNDDDSKNYMGTGYSYPVSGSTRTITVHSETYGTTYTWDMYPTNIQWTSINNKAVFYINTPGNYLLTVEGTDGCDSQLMFFSIQIGGNNNLSMYPNPVIQGSMTVNINSSSTSSTLTGGSSNQVKIYDVYGVERFSNSYNSNNFTINGLNFEPGNYILNVTTTNGSVIQEIIIIE